MLGFETLTFAPIDVALVEPKLFDDDEIGWLDAYHARGRKKLSPRVDASTRAWLAKATRRLAVVKARRDQAPAGPGTASPQAGDSVLSDFNGLRLD